MLDYLYMHKNVPPFFARKMIQRLVTSNPSPGYIEDVARAFVDGTYMGFLHTVPELVRSSALEVKGPRREGNAVKILPKPPS